MSYRGVPPTAKHNLIFGGTLKIVFISFLTYITLEPFALC